MIQILHNPRCGKSRQCLAFLNESNYSIHINHYLEHPLSEKELEELLVKLNLKPIDLVRQKENIWKEKYKDQPLNEKAIIKAMAEHPILIERPILINGDHAIIARELEKIKDFI